MDSNIASEGDTGVKLTLIYVIGPGDTEITFKNDMTSKSVSPGTLVELKSRKVEYGIRGESSTFVVMVRVSGPKDKERLI